MEALVGIAGFNPEYNTVAEKSKSQGQVARPARPARVRTGEKSKLRQGEWPTDLYDVCEPSCCICLSAFCCPCCMASYNSYLLQKSFDGIEKSSLEICILMTKTVITKSICFYVDIVMEALCFPLYLLYQIACCSKDAVEWCASDEYDIPVRKQLTHLNGIYEDDELCSCCPCINPRGSPCSLIQEYNMIRLLPNRANTIYAINPNTGCKIEPSQLDIGRRNLKKVSPV